MWRRLNTKGQEQLIKETDGHVTAFADDGLRTLVIAKKDPALRRAILNADELASAACVRQLFAPVTLAAWESMSHLEACTPGAEGQHAGCEQRHRIDAERLCARLRTTWRDFAAMRGAGVWTVRAR